MKRLVFSFLALAAVLSSCTEKNGAEEKSGDLSGFLILNNGNFGSNDASLSVFDPESGEVSGDLFFSANSQHLGDLGQDMAFCGEDLYIAVNGSRVVFVTDRDLVIKKKIEASADGHSLSPRCLCSYGGKMYVTYYEGYLGEIDGSDFSVRTVAVGPNPEGVTSAGGRLYVANSGGLLPGFSNTLSVVDPSTFTVTGQIEVNTNPNTLAASADGSTVYVYSYGDFAGIPPMLQAVDAATSAVTDTGYEDVKGIARGGDNTLLVVTGGYDANWNVTGTVRKYDMTSGCGAGDFAPQSISKYYSISADPESGVVFVGTSDYQTEGDVYCFNPDGTLRTTFASRGLNPIKVLAL